MKIREQGKAPTGSHPKHLGVYYTGEDVTDYIARNTIIPFLFDAAARRCPAAFAPGGLIWGRWQDQPERYLDARVRKGVELPLPPKIAAGLADVSRRTDWNRPAHVSFALPGETWREHVARRRRCRDLEHRLREGEIRTIDDLITFNLDIGRFAQNTIAQCETSELLSAFWDALRGISILDPACGSGEFLLAAVRVLAPLYEACLGRLRQCGEKPSVRSPFIPRSILGNNLFGADIREEAVALCRHNLRVETGALAPARNFRIGDSLSDLALRADSWSLSAMRECGFDVILGNPPYVEARTAGLAGCSDVFATSACGNLAAYFLERSATLVAAGGRIGMILPLSAISTDRMAPLIREIKARSALVHIANFGWRPGKLFEDVNLPLSIILQKIKAPSPDAVGSESEIYSTNYLLWDTAARSPLFSRVEFARVRDARLAGAIPKLGCPLAAAVLAKLRAEAAELRTCLVRRSANRVYYRRGGLYWKVFVDVPTGSSEEKILHLRSDVDRYVVVAVLSSSLWFWYFTATSDCRHLGNRDIGTFPLDLGSLSATEQHDLGGLGRDYVADLKRHARRKTRLYRTAGPVECLAFQVKKSKPLIDAIDRVLACHYGFSDEELDFIINFDIKYRLG